MNVCVRARGGSRSHRRALLCAPKARHTATHTHCTIPHPLLPTAIDFRYSDPERGFDRSRVKGVVAKLTRVADPSTSTALEVAAGGKLYQVRGGPGRGWGVRGARRGRARRCRLAGWAGCSGCDCGLAGNLHIIKRCPPTLPPHTQVVVDTEQTAKALLANGQLRQRVTIIPLNK